MAFKRCEILYDGNGRIHQAVIDQGKLEVETGKGSDAVEQRPRLAAGLKAARKAGCPVLVAKLDRLSRPARVAQVRGVSRAGVTAVTGGPWYASSVRNVALRLGLV